MLENNAFNQEWNKIQRGIEGSSITVNSDSDSRDRDSKDSSQTSHFTHWLTEADSFWGSHAKVASGDIDSLYKKVSSCSHFFLKFSEALTPKNEGETVENLIAKYFETFETYKNGNGDTERSATSSGDNKNNKEDIDLVSFWKMPLENLQKQSSLFTTLNSFQTGIPASVADMAENTENPELKKAFETYLLSLQQYQMAFVQLFMDSAKQAVELMESSSEVERSAKQIMAMWLDILEKNYEVLIAGNDYSKLYAGVLNSWVLMLSKSEKSFSEIMQAGSNASWAQSNG